MTEEDQMAYLSPCPFCGGGVYFTQADTGYHTFTRIDHVEAGACWLIGPDGCSDKDPKSIQATVNSLAEKWNTRNWG